MPVLLRLTLTEAKLFFRDPMIWIFALAFPPLLLIIFGAIPAFREADPELGGLRVIDLYAPILVAIGVTILAVYNLPQQFAAYREKGVLRRMRTTPVRPRALLGALLLLFTGLSVLTLVVVLTVARLAFGVPLPADPFAYAVAYLLTVLALFAVGLLVAAVAPSSISASAIGLILFFAFAFVGGLWIPRDRMSEVLRAVSDLTPIGAGVQSLQDAAAGGWPALASMLVLAGWMIVAGALAARLFRWE